MKRALPLCLAFCLALAACGRGASSRDAELAELERLIANKRSKRKKKK